MVSILTLSFSGLNKEKLLEILESNLAKGSVHQDIDDNFIFHKVIQIFTWLEFK